MDEIQELKRQIEDLECTIECLDCDCAYAEGQRDAFKYVVDLLLHEEDLV